MKKIAALILTSIILISSSSNYAYTNKENCGVKSVCVEVEEVKGHYDETCLYTLNLPCEYIDPSGKISTTIRAGCEVVSRASCYVPGYTKCARYEKQLTCQGETDVIN